MEQSNNRLVVAAEGTHLLRDGEPFVVVADTAWSAFADAGAAEWSGYIRMRRSQGFNTVLVSVLPILHDRAIREEAREPFRVTSEGHYDFDAPDEEYFSTARAMATVARAQGMTLALVVLWCNYVPGTWGADRTPWAVMSDEQRSSYIAYMADVFSEFEPIFVVSGDEHFHDERPTYAYLDALRRTKAAAPNCLTTLHSTPNADLPAVLADAPELDFYSYQAGHDLEKQSLTWELASSYLAKAVRRPVIDFEPCYEGHGFGTGAGRFRAINVRNATWWSIAGGASAGIGYGAHGVWQWYRPGATFTNPGFSLEPFPRVTAERFSGADDVAFAAQLVRAHRLYETTPRQDLLVGPEVGFRLAATDDLGTVLVYLPDAREVRLKADLRNYDITAWDLDARKPVSVSLRVEHDESAIGQVDTLSDVAIIGVRRA